MTTAVALVLIAIEVVALVSAAVCYLRRAVDRHQRIARMAANSVPATPDSTPITPR